MTVFLLWEWKKITKDRYNFLMKNKHIFAIILPFLSFSSMSSHNSQVLLYLNGLNPCIKILDMFWNIGNFILWSEEGNKRSSCSDYSKYGSFILGKLEKKIRKKVPFWNLWSINWRGKMILWHSITCS